MLAVANPGVPSDRSASESSSARAAASGTSGKTAPHAGFQTFYIAFPSKGVGAVIFTNGDNGADLIDEIESAIAKTYDWPA